MHRTAKWFVMRIIAFICLLMLPCSVKAETSGQIQRHIGVVLVGNPEFKIPAMYKFIREKLTPQEIASYTISVGDDVQSKYLEYWVNKGFLEEQPLKSDDLTAFVNESGYDKILYIFETDASINYDSNRTLLTTVIDILWGISPPNVTTANVVVHGILCDKATIVKYQGFNADNMTFSDDHNELKFYAFKQCIREISRDFRGDF